VGDRLFIAVNLSKGALDELGALVKTLLRIVPGARPTRPEGMHVTLAFLGGVETARRGDVVAAMRAACRAVPAFRLVLGGAGAFPSWDMPRVVWLGVAEGASELKAVESVLRAELTRSGFAPEPRPFHPHVTLCRVGRASSSSARRLEKEAGRLCASVDWSPHVMDVAGIDLMKSETRSGGPVYTRLYREEFQ